MRYSKLQNAKTIILYACNSGVTDNFGYNVAQDLENISGIPVIAPTAMYSPNMNEMYSFVNSSGNQIDTNGIFIIFNPQE